MIACQVQREGEKRRKGVKNRHVLLEVDELKQTNINKITHTLIQQAHINNYFLFKCCLCLFSFVFTLLKAHCVYFSVFFHFTLLFKLSHKPSALLIHLWGDADIGDPGYKAIPGSSWQLQEVTATFLAHCPTAVKWHMLSYCWASGKKAPVWKRNLEQQNKKKRLPESFFCQKQSCDITALEIVTREERDMVHYKEIHCIILRAMPAPAQWMHAFTQQNMHSPKCCLVAAVNATCADTDTLE